MPVMTPANTRLGLGSSPGPLARAASSRTVSDSEQAASETTTKGRKSIGLRRRKRSSPISSGSAMLAAIRSRASAQLMWIGESVPASITAPSWLGDGGRWRVR